MFLITGCGKSGTVWASYLMAHLGYYCQHEEQFSLDSHGPLASAEVSWLAVPYLDTIPSFMPIIHIIRNPYYVVQSAVRMRLFQPRYWSRYEDFIVKHQPQCNHHEYLTRIIRWATGWDKQLLKRDIPRLYVDGPVNEVHATLGAIPGYRNKVSLYKLTWEVLALGRIHRSPEKRWAPTVEEINQHREGWRVRQRAERLGYL